jgi:hypothetical protein
MASVDPSAVWVMQAWPFYNERFFWGADQIKVPKLPVITPTLNREP